MNLYKIKKVFLLGFIGALLGSMLSSAQALGQTWQFKHISNGLVDGFIIALSLAFYTVYASDGWLRPWLRKLGFGLVLFINSSCYTWLILVGRASGRYLMGDDGFSLFPGGAEFYQSIIFAFIGAVVVNFFLENNRLLGHSVLRHLFTGKYHQPRHEQRVFMFLDLADSTSIAEAMGPQKYLHLLDNIFSDLTDLILFHRAKIYKYIGDEVVLYWRLKDAFAHNNCFHFFLAVEKLLQRYNESTTIGTTLRFRAGLHAGEIYRGELGHLKKELAFMGDTINTAARLLDFGKKKDYRLVMSEIIYQDLVGLAQPLKKEDNVLLKGKREALKVFALE